MSGKIDSDEVLDRFESTLARELTVLEGGNIIEYQFDRLSNSAFDRLGKPKMDFISNALEEHRYWKVNVLSNNLFPKQLRVVSTQQLKVERGFYRSAGMNAPLICREYIGAISNKRIGLDHELRSSVNDPVLLKQRIWLTYINNSGQSIHLSVGLKNMLMARGVETTPAPRVSNQEPPSDCHVYYVTPAPSDMDNLLHVNQSKFITYYLDAAYETGMAGSLCQFPGDIARYDLKEAVLFYRAQVVAGDKLEVRVWEDPTLPRTLNFRISRGDTIVNMATFRFYEDQTKL